MIVGSVPSSFLAAADHAADDSTPLLDTARKLTFNSPTSSRPTGNIVTNPINRIAFRYTHQTDIFAELSQRLLIKPFDANSIKEEFTAFTKKGVSPIVIVSAMVDTGMFACNAARKEDKANTYILRLSWFFKNYLPPVSTNNWLTSFAATVGKSAVDALFDQISAELGGQTIVPNPQVGTARMTLLQVFKASAAQYKLARYQHGQCQEGNEIEVSDTFKLFEQTFTIQSDLFAQAHSKPITNNKIEAGAGAEPEPSSGICPCECNIQ